MLTGNTKAKLDSLLSLFWNNGMTNPLTVTEQITYLLFIRLLELKKHDLHNDMNWSSAAKLPPEKMFAAFSEILFPTVRKNYPELMDDALFLVPSPKVLGKAVATIDSVNIDGQDIMGDVYEYLLSKLASSGTNGQFRTPRHIIRLIADIMQPSPDDSICDPAMGSAGFLCAAAEYSSEKSGALPSLSGCDTDRTMHRIGTMNLLLHGVNAPLVTRVNSLSADSIPRDSFTLILANPPFTGSLDSDEVAPDLLEPCTTKKTELLFLRLFLKILRKGGRCASVVPEGVLSGTSKAAVQIRRTLLEDNRLDAVISLPDDTFRPYAGIRTAILIFTKSAPAENVWFCDMNAMNQNTAASDTAVNFRRRTDHKDRKICFLVSREEIAEKGFSLSLRSYMRLTGNSSQDSRSSQEILGDILALEKDITASLEKIGGLING